MLKMQNKDIKEKEELNDNADLIFCFESIVILEEALTKLNYIGNFTYSNSASVMSNSIGQQIENKMKHQRELENDFEKLIVEKSSKTELLEEKEINELSNEIKRCAKNLKDSTNDICKSLEENPDIPLNLKKSKNNKNSIIEKINEIKTDLVNGSFDKFELILLEIEKNSIKIDEKRKREMHLLGELKKLNEILFKEESDYIKDTKNLENRLVIEKKILAKTKMEEQIFMEYRKNELNALKTFKKKKFNDGQSLLEKDIVEKNKEKVFYIFSFIQFNFDFNFYFYNFIVLFYISIRKKLTLLMIMY